MEQEEVMRRLDKAREGIYTERGYSDRVIENVRKILELGENSEKVKNTEVHYGEPYFLVHSVDVHLTERFNNLEEFVAFLEEFQLPFTPCAKILGKETSLPKGYHPSMSENPRKIYIEGGKKYIKPEQVNDGEYHAISGKVDWRNKDEQAVLARFF